MSNLSTIITTGLNNPDCAFYTGQMFGQFATVRLILYLLVAGWLFKSLDKLAIEPGIEAIKKRLYKKKEMKKNAEN